MTAPRGQRAAAAARGGRPAGRRSTGPSTGPGAPARPSGSGLSLRRRAEAALLDAEAPGSAPLAPAEARRLLHELRVHQIELEMQNDELRLAQQELEASRARYFGLYELAPVGYLTLSAKGMVLEANLTAAVLLGVARGGLVRQPLTRHILPEDQDVYYQHRRRLLETGEPQVCELRMQRPDGSRFWVRLDATTVPDLPGGPPVSRVTLHDTTARRQAEDGLRCALAERDVLLKEVHHRVKNNLSVVCSLLRLQAGHIGDPRLKEALEASQDRVRAMASVHEQLYRSASLARLDFRHYIRELAANLFHAQLSPGHQARFALQMADAVTLDLDTAIPCGLLVNELLTNALKHAFPATGDASRNEITLTWEEAGTNWRLTVADNGVGLPGVDPDWTHPRTLGLRLVQALAQQLRGTARLDPNPACAVTANGASARPGCAVVIEFPKPGPVSH